MIDKKTGIHEPTVIIPIGMDCRDVPKGFMSTLEFHQAFGPIDPAYTAWARAAAKSITEEHLSKDAS